jgi:hypothetical protein
VHQATIDALQGIVTNQRVLHEAVQTLAARLNRLGPR